MNTMQCKHMQIPYKRHVDIFLFRNSCQLYHLSFSNGHSESVYSVIELNYLYCVTFRLKYEIFSSLENFKHYLFTKY
ncbi:hypothetical protein T05_9848 [Trichinella murrelli]|uniref:Uncharacterized protein n=1 Tax=Trichinella murrelli TaxID=144512 RepID=A0A0V0T549_9BILA|nr:hypothetical protein T05_3920 [Trichinella murrelli]KRX35726.1 hypothetical protein T05_9848 [Trichinella murrelli]